MAASSSFLTAGVELWLQLVATHCRSVAVVVASKRVIVMAQRIEHLILPHPTVIMEFRGYLVELQNMIADGTFLLAHCG